MLDIIILETAQHMDDGIDLADIAEKLVAKALALARPAHEACNVDKAQLRLDDLRRTANFGNGLQARIGHRDIADIRFNRAKRIIRRLRRRRLCQRVEQRGLAHIRQPDNSAFETHFLALC